MFFETPQDTYNAYLKFLKKKQFKQAYRCLEKMLRYFPDDESLILDVVNLAYFDLKSKEMAKTWLHKLTSVRQVWLYYAMLCECELGVGTVENARQSYEMALKLEKKQKNIKIPNVCPM